MSDHLQPEPPWIVFHRGDGTADILPAGRPGAIVEGLPLVLAQQIVSAANKWRLAEATSQLRQAAQKIAEVRQEIAAIKTCNRHSDCDAADAKARAAGHLCADHCHDDCCEDCFGS